MLAASGETGEAFTRGRGSGLTGTEGGAAAPTQQLAQLLHFEWGLLSLLPGAFSQCPGGTLAFAATSAAASDAASAATSGDTAGALPLYDMKAAAPPCSGMAAIKIHNR